MKYLLFISVVLASFCTFAQSDKPNFHPPVDLPIYLSGNFAELRRNHFHTGLDIKTGGVEGQNIRSAESGRVSRIAISPVGYGKVLYIDHDNGYTTVYAHLSSFSEKITKVARAEQYARESFAIDFTPTEEVRVERGELIALSGNSGSSGGPHLHFEIRTTEGSRPQNPLLFGFDIADNIAPRMRGVRFHPLTDTSLVNGGNEAKAFVVQGDAGKYRLQAGQSVNVYGAVGLSLHAHDFLDGQSNKCGIYSLTLEVDGDVLCTQRFDSLDFATNRQINCYKDYAAFRRSSWHYHKSYREPGNALPIYPTPPVNDGVVAFAASGTHQVKYTATDAKGNASVLEFTFTSLDRPNGKFAAQQPYDAYFFRNRDNTYDYADELHLTVPAQALYRDLQFQFGREIATSGQLSPCYSVHHDLVPLDKAITLSIGMKEVPLRLRDKVVAARYSASGSPAYLSGKAEGDFYVLQSKDFGRYCLFADTVPPTLVANAYSRGGSLNARSELGFAIGDDRSGIKHFEGRLNGKWVLMEYEPKKKLLYMKAGDSGFQKGANTLQVTVTDHCGNANTQKFNYTYP